MRKLHTWKAIHPVELFGSDGEEDDSDDPQVGAKDDVVDESTEETFSADYVSKLRKESASKRIAAKDATDELAKVQAELAAIQKAEMSDIDQMRTELETAQTALESATEASTVTAANLKTERIRNAVTMAAISAGFVDPSDALSMISQDDLVTDEGIIDDKAVEKNLKALAKKKPHLLKSHNRGSGDGAGSGQPVAPDTFEGKQAAYLKDMTTSGGRVARR